MTQTTERAGGAAGDPQADVLRLRRGLEALLGVPATEGNSVDVLRNGTEAFPAMLSAIASARDTVDLLAFQLGTGGIVEDFARVLAERARAGVRVRVLVDSLGSRKLDRGLVWYLRESGVDFEWFRPLHKMRVWEHENRTHRKVLVIDRRLGFAGGINTSEEWADGGDEPRWRDTHLQLRGPAVDGLIAAFTTDWVDAGRAACELDDEFPPQEQAGNSAVQVIRGSAEKGWSDVANALAALLTLARRRVRIVSAYFAPDDNFATLLCEAGRRGVDVEVLLPGRNADQRYVQLAAEAQFSKLLDAGVRVWSYQPSMIHAKVVLVDDVVACVGSANFDRRSFKLNHEVEIIVLDPSVVAELDKQYDEDVADSERIVAAQWARRSTPQRLMEAAVRPLRGRL